VTCEMAQTAVHGYFDGELDAVRAQEFESHMETCAECRNSLKQLNELRGRFERSGLYQHASAELEKQIRKKLGINDEPLGSAEVRGFAWRPRYSWVLIPAFAAMAAGFAVWVTLGWVQPRTYSARITAAVIDAHVRSLQPGHLTDVESTDQHTVKPWFDGKLDFIPPVADYSEQGFPLVGGRLDVVDGHNVAALVYARRKHFINLFAWPNEKGEETMTNGAGSRRGYNWVTWRSGDVRLCLVSDASINDLRQLKELIHP
jgi:anti-sigma factor RsiW